MDDGALLTPFALGVKEAVSPSEWIDRLMATEKESPLTVFSKTFCPYSLAAKTLLEKYDLNPRPFIIEANLRNDSMRIKAYLNRLTGRATFPNLILKAQSLGGYDDLRDYENKHQLEHILDGSGLRYKAQEKTAH